jgi:uncharacterized protein (DUF302 family)
MRLSTAFVCGILLAAGPALAHAQTSTAPAKSPAAKATAPSDLVKRAGWNIYPTKHAFGDLVKRLEAAVKKNKMGIVTTASASDGAKAQGFTIPGNRVVGVFRNDFARRMLAVSTAAGIEAPIRLYLTENANGTATLSYRSPSAVFAPYARNTRGRVDKSKADLTAMAKELDAIFAQIALDTIDG